MNPLSNSFSEEQNKALVKASLQGDKKALSQLIKYHQPFIYNVAWKMCHDPNDAADLTQEVLIKVITKLSQFNFKSQFRTWLYRIVTNEFLQGKRRKSESHFISFEHYGKQLDAVPNGELTKEEEITSTELSKEMQYRCMSGMLMCLNREQRLIYILGETFGIDHNLGAELFSISPQNFRVKLHRARKELYNYMNQKCGLVNKSNPCRCPKKAKTLREMGMLDETDLQFNIESKTRIADYVDVKHEELRDAVEDVYVQLYREHPTKDNFTKSEIVEHIVNNDAIRNHLNLN